MEETKTNPPITESASETPIKGQNTRERTKTIQLDLEAYMPLFDEIEISENEKRELLRSLYAIIHSFIDLGFRVETKLPSCGQVKNDSSKTSDPLRSHIYSTHQTLIENTKNAAVSSSDAAQKGVDA